MSHAHALASGPVYRSEAPNSQSRFTSIDVLRGLAMVWMTVFHFCFDLDYFGWWPQDFLHDPRWTLQRTAIVTLFVFCAGLSQSVAHGQALGWPRFWKRWWQIVACAALVSAGSWVMFPQSFIYFGILHGMAVMLLVARLSAGWGVWLWPLGLLAIAAPVAAHALLTGGLDQWAYLMDSRQLNWLGLIGRKPFTEDYVPLLPWLGVMWWGLAAGAWLLRRRRYWLSWQVPNAAKPLCALGRWSLSYYMLHQPVMMGAMSLVTWALHRSS